MPTYDYRCDVCGHEFEREQRISEPPVKKCPKCRKMKSRRMITNGNFILKGGGWYADGYSASSGGNGGSHHSSPPQAGDSSSDSSTKSESTKTKSEAPKKSGDGAGSHAST